MIKFLIQIFLRNCVKFFGAGIIYRYLSKCMFYTIGANNGDPNGNGEYLTLRKIFSVPNKKNRICLDVGGNVGDWSAKAIEYSGSNKLNILIFEPVPICVERLKKRFTKSMHRGEISIFPFGLADLEGKKKIFIEAKDASIQGSNSVYDRKSVNWKNSDSFWLNFVPGDSVLIQENKSEIFYVKIDVEGSEMDVLMGLYDHINNNSLDYIQFEYGGTWIDARRFLFEAFELLNGCNYEMYAMQSWGLLKVKDYSPEFEHFNYMNWLAVSPKVGLPVDLKVKEFFH